MGRIELKAREGGDMLLGVTKEQESDAEANEYPTHNVNQEWTETSTYSYVSDIESGGTIFIRRGGSWWHEAKNCRVLRRYASDHSKKTSGLGLRVVIRDN